MLYRNQHLCARFNRKLFVLMLDCSASIPQLLLFLNNASFSTGCLCITPPSTQTIFCQSSPTSYAFHPPTKRPIVKVMLSFLKDSSFRAFRYSCGGRNIVSRSTLLVTAPIAVSDTAPNKNATLNHTDNLLSRNSTSQYDPKQFHGTSSFSSDLPLHHLSV